MKDPMITLWMAAGALEAQSRPDDKVRLLTCRMLQGSAGRAGSAKVNPAWREAKNIALSFNVEPAGSIKLKYLNLGRCNSKK